jgi:hypothetical protein
MDTSTGNERRDQREAGSVDHAPTHHHDIEIGGSCIDLIETRNDRQARIAEYWTPVDLIVVDELGYLLFAQSGGQLLFRPVSRLYKGTSVRRRHQQSRLR